MASKKFDNDRVEVTVNTKPGCQVEMDVLVKPEACKAAREAAIKQIRQRISVPGFRKGKAPLPMVEKNYAKAIDENWHEGIGNAALREALGLTAIYPWSGEGVPPPEVESISIEDGARMTFKYECEPDIPEIDPKGLSVEKEKAKEITEEQVAEEELGLRRQRATYETVEDGVVEEGGFCRLDLESLEGDEPVSILTDRRIHLKKGEIADWLLKIIVGKKADETGEGLNEPSLDASEEQKANFKQVTCRATIKAVEKEVLPDDEELLGALKVESMEELRKRMRSRLEQAEEQRIEQELRGRLWEQLREKYPFEMPNSLLESELKATINRMVGEMRQGGLDDAAIAAQESAIEQKAASEVEERLHTLFLARRVANLAKLEPVEKDVLERVQEMVLWESLSQGRQINMDQLDQGTLGSLRNKAYFMLVQERAEDHLLKQAEAA